MTKIGIFAYNFPHWKTQQTILNLIISGQKPDVIFAADKVELNHYQSKIRIAPLGLHLWHPKKIAEQFGIPYHVVTHNSNETSMMVKEYDLDIGVISGARILKPIAFENFRIGVINMHPGILPENRGLDTIKWAIINNLPQGASVHIIDSNIDRGQLICKSHVEIYSDDTLVDIQIRVQNKEQELLLKALEIIQESGDINFPKLGVGKYNSSVPEDLESTLMARLPEYVKKQSL